jgi:DNA-binding HxlR family transcriptional regulator
MSLPETNCAIDATMSVIGGRWKPIPMCKLAMKGNMRFNQILRDIEGISPRMLTKQLKELERDGLLCREVYNEMPPRVEYSLTERGWSLMPVLSALAQWGIANMLRAVVNVNEKYLG